MLAPDSAIFCFRI